MHIITHLKRVFLSHSHLHCIVNKAAGSFRSSSITATSLTAIENNARSYELFVFLAYNLEFQLQTSIISKLKKLRFLYLKLYLITIQIKRKRLALLNQPFPLLETSVSQHSYKSGVYTAVVNRAVIIKYGYYNGHYYHNCKHRPGNTQCCTDRHHARTKLSQTEYDEKHDKSLARLAELFN